jgi:Fe-S oxidoreductase
MCDILYSCTMCFNCAEQCRFPFGPDIVSMLTAAREHFLETLGVSPRVKKVLESIYLYGNPWRKRQKDRGRWAEGMEIPIFNAECEYLFYVGDIGSYDPTGCRAALALARIFIFAGLSFGILGADEYSDGMDVLEMGEVGLFEELAGKNIPSFRTRGVEKIVCLSPHSYHAMKQDYPKQDGGSFRVEHYSRLIASLLSKGRLSFSERFPETVTYHDPCILGRRNGEYDAPRAILKHVSGLRLVEMRRNKINSRCCGGGGGNCFIDTLGGGREAPARRRVREALNTGADILAVSCPACLIMLHDAVKAEHLEGKLRVMDISEIVAGVLFSPADKQNGHNSRLTQAGADRDRILE